MIMIITMITMITMIMMMMMMAELWNITMFFKGKPSMSCINGQYFL